jgi:hypothetical protein
VGGENRPLVFSLGSIIHVVNSESFVQARPAQNPHYSPHTLFEDFQFDRRLMV